jgi:hypothetical protein
MCLDLLLTARFYGGLYFHYTMPPPHFTWREGSASVPTGRGLFTAESSMVAQCLLYIARTTHSALDKEAPPSPSFPEAWKANGYAGLAGRSRRTVAMEAPESECCTALLCCLLSAMCDGECAIPEQGSSLARWASPGATSVRGSIHYDDGGV